MFLFCNLGLGGCSSIWHNGTRVREKDWSGTRYVIVWPHLHIHLLGWRNTSSCPLIVMDFLFFLTNINFFTLFYIACDNHPDKSERGRSCVLDMVTVPSLCRKLALDQQPNSELLKQNKNHHELQQLRPGSSFHLILGASLRWKDLCFL